MFRLRPYQLDANRAVWRAFNSNDAVLLQAPTGSGKTLMASHLISMRLEHKRERVLMLAHRREIVHQTANKMMEGGLETGIIMAGEAPEPPWVRARREKRAAHKAARREGVAETSES